MVCLLGSDVGLSDMILSALTVVLVFGCLVSCDDVGKPCTYFGGGRISSSQGNLVNCSWYSSNACCQRTEVTSVFGGMYPLYGASRECSNQLNYLMCYFCSPKQHMWYHEKAYVCADYCRAIHDHCKTAMYNGESVGASYTTGEDFCRGQKFSVAENGQNCFKFDPLVFATATQQTCDSYVLLSLVVYSLLRTQFTDMWIS